jgi:hypothetical protein
MNNLKELKQTLTLTGALGAIIALITVAGQLGLCLHC